MKHVSVSYFNPVMSSVVTNNDMLSVRINIIQDKNLWGVRRGGQYNSIVFIGNRNVSWKRIRGISGSFVWAGTITNGNVRDIQRWANNVNWKGIIEAVIKCTVVVLYH